MFILGGWILNVRFARFSGIRGLLCGVIGELHVAAKIPRQLSFTPPQVMIIHMQDRLCCRYSTPLRAQR